MQSYEKSRAGQKKYIFFSCRDKVTSRFYRKDTNKRVINEINRDLFLYPSESIFDDSQRYD